MLDEVSGRNDSAKCAENIEKKKDSRLFENGIEKLWSYEKAAEFLDVSVRTLKRRVRSRKIHFIKIGRRVLFVPWILREQVSKGGLL